jgi:16S rRNA (guanine527-N7)-methyltransferase
MVSAGHNDAGKILAQVPGAAGRIDTDKLSLYITDLLSWNPRIGLISKRDTADVLVRLIAKSIQLWDLLAERVPEIVLREGVSVIDIGSGGGFPGIIWHLLNPEINVLLVERKGKKAFFLEKSALQLGGTALSVLQKDARDLVRDPRHAEAYDAAVIMAVAPPEQMGETVEGLLKPGGVFLAPRGEGVRTFSSTIGTCMGIHSAVESPEGPVLIYKKLLK